MKVSIRLVPFLNIMACLLMSSSSSSAVSILAARASIAPIPSIASVAPIASIAFGSVSKRFLFMRMDPEGMLVRARTSTNYVWTIEKGRRWRWRWKLHRHPPESGRVSGRRYHQQHQNQIPRCDSTTIECREWNEFSSAHSHENDSNHCCFQFYPSFLRFHGTAQAQAQARNIIPARNSNENSSSGAMTPLGPFGTDSFYSRNARRSFVSNNMVITTTSPPSSLSLSSPLSLPTFGSAINVKRNNNRSGILASSSSGCSNSRISRRLFLGSASSTSLNARNSIRDYVGNGGGDNAGSTGAGAGGVSRQRKESSRDSSDLQQKPTHQKQLNNQQKRQQNQSQRTSHQNIRYQLQNNDWQQALPKQSQANIHQQSHPPKPMQQTEPPQTQQPQWNLHPTNSNPLQPPEILFSNNHLLVVNKPPGWKSQPGHAASASATTPATPSDGIEVLRTGTSDPKCLLSTLQSHRLGGGSLSNFLIPTHRLDQPCTGVLIFAKNGKAASRVQVAFGAGGKPDKRGKIGSKRGVEKCYWVVVEGGDGGCDSDDDGLELLRSRSTRLESDGTSYRLSAAIRITNSCNNGRRGRNGKGRGGPRGGKEGGSSVRVSPPLVPNDGNASNDGRVCHIEWKHLLKLPLNRSSRHSKPTRTSRADIRASSNSNSSNGSRTRHLLSVTTDTGAKHQVRALLALAGGTPIAGDLRYGNENNEDYYRINSIPSDAAAAAAGRRAGRVDRPLPDGSVALHARSVFLPMVSLGGMEFLKEEPFVARIPESWIEFFGVCEEDVEGF